MRRSAESLVLGLFGVAPLANKPVKPVPLPEPPQPRIQRPKLEIGNYVRYNGYRGPSRTYLVVATYKGGVIVRDENMEQPPFKLHNQNFRYGWEVCPRSMSGKPYQFNYKQRLSDTEISELDNLWESEHCMATNARHGANANTV